MKRTAVILVLLCGLGVILWGVVALRGRASVDVNGPPALQPARAEASLYAGSASCAECHQEIFDEWKTSHHALAQRLVSAEIDKPAFDPPREIRHGTQVSFVELKDGEYLIRTMGPDGKQGTFKPDQVLGVFPLWQYIINIGNGRRQLTELAYDPAKNEWFNVFGDEDRQAWEWGHWSNRGMNWNAMCATCHTTSFQKNYDPQTDGYRSTYLEMGVGCEACHGPMKAHVAWQDANPKQTGDPTVRTPTRDEYFNTCGACHARRTDLTGAFTFGEQFLEHYEPMIPDLGDTFYPDGQVRDEDFEFAPFLLSYMHGQDVRCVDCHGAHTGKIHVNDDSLCLRCHAEPVTNKIAIIPEEHSHHPAGKPGSACVDCHMPLTPYMQRHLRRDHGMTVPDPVLTKEFNIPNACTRCHEKEGIDWAIGHVEQWYGLRMDRPTRRRARLLARMKAGDFTAAGELLNVLTEQTNPTWRAVIVKFLTPVIEGLGSREHQVAALAAMRPLLDDPSPLVQAAVVEAMEPLASMIQPEIERKLESQHRLVRLKAAWVLRRQLDLNSLAGRDFMARLRFNQDQPTGALQWAHFHADRNRLDLAMPWFKKSIQWDPGSAPSRHSYAVALSRAGRLADAVTQLVKAAELAPAEPLYPYSLGLAYAEMGQMTAARDAIKAAIARNPRIARYWYNLALAEHRVDNATVAMEAIRKAQQLDAHNADYVYVEASILHDLGRSGEAATALRRALVIDPNHDQSRQLLAAIGAGLNK